MDYGFSDFGLQYSSIEDVELEFAKAIAPARTFGLLSEISYLKEKNLIKGGDLNNAVVFVDQEINKKEQEALTKTLGKSVDLNFKKGSILNTEGLRFDNEPVRHKVLDLIGDLSLFGKPIFGHVIAKRSGHGANIELVKLLRSNYYEN
jgi:UDP-3-O-[3-hydroxymyristoyl] N-acetylglucosamine deacetylase/3-hydroxyacyl-[acyl-carrier-protein] dehydratase